MQSLVLLLGFLVIANLILDQFPEKKKNLRPQMFITKHYEFGGLVTRPMLSKTELLFLQRLENAFDEYTVFAQVQLSAFIRPPSGKNYQATLNRYHRQSADFVLCDAEMNVIAAVELDDKSHVGRNSRERDAKKDDVFREAGIPLFRWHAEKMPTPTVIRKEFDARLFPELNS